MAETFAQYFEQLQREGYVILDVGLFFKSKKQMEIQRKRLEMLLLSRALVDDQAGAIRYHLDDLCALQTFIRWLMNPLLIKLMRGFISSEDLQINYVRYREPYYGGGLQRFHYDWHPDSPERRIEVFIAFDDIDRENGCTQIISPITGNIIDLPLTSGSVLCLNSCLSHRGTRNRSGNRRRLVSMQIARQTDNTSPQVSGFPLKLSAPTPEFNWQRNVSSELSPKL